jgi:hypothetical protein
MMEIKAEHKTSTYLTAGGYYCIRQEGDAVETPHGDTPKIFLSPSQMLRLIEDMELHLQDATWWTEQLETEEPIKHGGAK